MTRILPLSLLASTMFLASCATVTNEQWVRLASITAEHAARVAVTADLMAHPEHRPMYDVAVIALGKLIDSGTWDKDAFFTALAALPIRDRDGRLILRDENGALILEGSVFVYDLLTSTFFDLSSSPAIEAVMRATRNGIASGLAAGQPATKAPPKIQPIEPYFPINPDHRMTL